MDKTLQMVFQNEVGDNTSISISQIKEGLTDAEVKALMNLIISKNIFESTGGDLITVMSASVVAKDVEDFKVR